MVLRPKGAEELRVLLATASDRGEAVGRVDVRELNEIVEHRPEDMTATVQAGLTVAELQMALGKHQQWLPIDPVFPEEVTIGRLLGHNLSGPRRYGFGTIRDYLIGLKVALANGEFIKAGGKVVKNVAGYDLCKLFVGAKDSLGVIVEATFKLRPIAEREEFLFFQAETIEEVEDMREKILSSGMEPVVLDMHNLAESSFTLVLGFAGAHEDVEIQTAWAKGIGFRGGSDLEYEGEFWRGDEPVARVSVLPSRAVETVRKVLPGTFVARLGNGVIYSRGSGFRQESAMPVKLMERIKLAYDPKGILPEFSE